MSNTERSSTQPSTDLERLNLAHSSMVSGIGYQVEAPDLSHCSLLR